MSSLNETHGDAERLAARREAVRGIGFLSPATLWTMAFFVAPLVVMVSYSFFTKRGTGVDTALSLANYEHFAVREVLWGSLFNSLEITLWTTGISILLAYPFAYVLAFRVPERWRRLCLVLAILPFWTSYIVRSYAWLLVLSPTGVVNQSLLWIGLVDEPIRLAYSRVATVMGFVHFFTMLLTLTIYANLVQLNPRYRLAAADLGANGWQSFYYVLLPLSIPGIVVGAFTTFVICIGDYIMPQILGGNRELVLPQAIFFQVSRNADLPLASAMSVILMLVVAVAYLASARWLRMDRL